MILITATVTVSPDNDEAYRSISRTQVLNSRNEPGCLDYSFYEDAMEPGTFIFVEKWKDQEALDFHFAQDYCLAFLKGARQYAQAKSPIEIHYISETRTP